MKNSGKILVTGGSGLLGSNVVRKLIVNGFDVVVLMRPSNIEKEKSFFFGCFKDVTDEHLARIEYAEGDVSDYFSVYNALQGVETVIHCAGKISFAKCDFDEMYRTNVLGVTNVVNACLEKGVKKLIHVSSIAVYNTDELNKGCMITEETGFKAASKKHTYAVTKMLGEREVWRGIAEGLNSVIFNPGVITGAGCGPKAVNSMFPNVEKLLGFYSKGSTGYVDVEDVADAIYWALSEDVKNDNFILVAENISVKELLTSFADILKIKKRKVYVSKFVLYLSSYIESFISKLLNKKPLLPKNFVKSLTEETAFSSEKYLKASGKSFKSISQSIDETFVALRKRGW